MSVRRSTRQSTLKRSITTESVTSSINSSAVGSPTMTPLKRSPSSTSMSSLDSDSARDAVAAQIKAAGNKMIDTYGNQFNIPDYTIKQIRDAIPAHCYQRSGARGLAYVARDLFYLSVVFTIYYNFVTPEYIPSTGLRAVLWALYTVVQGMVATGIWVLAHECGHQSFSPSKVLNDTVGFILHSALLVPYFSWKISHGKHHKATGNIERDMTWNPKTREQAASNFGVLAHQIHELTEETPIATVIQLVAQQLFGWPMYLMTNVTSNNNHERQPEGRGKGKQNGWFGGVNHFNPSSPLYEAKDAKLIFFSDLGLLAAGTVLYSLVQKFGFANMFVWYFLPYLWVNHWLGKSIHQIPSRH
jgi:omega-6 fatty acid desaturase / acyl-lipid omega-6 desaturase (Delta-12 desaturase)